MLFLQNSVKFRAKLSNNSFVLANVQFEVGGFLIFLVLLFQIFEFFLKVVVLSEKFLCFIEAEIEENFN